MTDDELKHLIVEASLSPLGVVVRTNSPERLRQRLYKIIKSLSADFTLSIPPESGDQLWLIKNA